jgi:hypothetical protein
MLSFSGWWGVAYSSSGVASNAPPGLQTTGIHQAILSLFPFRVFSRVSRAISPLSTRVFRGLGDDHDGSSKFARFPSHLEQARTSSGPTISTHRSRTRSVTNLTGRSRPLDSMSTPQFTAFERRLKFRRSHRLAQVIIHAKRKALFPIALHGMGRHGYDVDR